MCCNRFWELHLHKICLFCIKWCKLHLIYMRLYLISLQTLSYYLKWLDGCTNSFKRVWRDKRTRSTAIRTTSILKPNKTGTVHMVLPFYSHAALYGLNAMQVFQHIYTSLTSLPPLRTSRDVFGSLRNTRATLCVDDYLRKQNRNKFVNKKKGETLLFGE